MRSIVGSLVALASLVGCSNPVNEAKNEVAFVEKLGSQEDICAVYKKLEAAAQKAKDQSAYMEAKIRGGLACSKARYGIDDRDTEASNAALMNIVNDY